MKITSTSKAFSTTASLMMMMMLLGSARAQQQVRRGTITVTNVAPENGTCQSPVFVGIHDGSFDIFDLDHPVPATTERLVEDGNSGPLLEAFLATDGAAFGARVGDGPICTGRTLSVPFEVALTPDQPLYFSFGTMVLPSNDAFLSNDDPLAYEVFDEDGDFREVSIVLFGQDVLDAGSEVNTEAPEFTAFFGQMEPNAGPEQNGVVTEHPGHMPEGSGGILDQPRFANADFTAFRYRMLEIRVELDETDEPGLLSGFLGRFGN